MILNQKFCKILIPFLNKEFVNLISIEIIFHHSLLLFIKINVLYQISKKMNKFNCNLFALTVKNKNNKKFKYHINCFIILI